MRLSNLMKNAGLATLAAAMALTALPAAAQDGNRGHQAERGGGGERSRGGDGGGGYRGGRQANAPAAVAPQVRGNAAPTYQARDRSRQVSNGGDQGARNWDRGRDYRGQANVTARNQAAARAAAQVEQPTERRVAQARDNRASVRYQGRDSSTAAYRTNADRRGQSDYRGTNRADADRSNNRYAADASRSRYDNDRSRYDNDRSRNDRGRSSYNSGRSAYDNGRAGYNNGRSSYNNGRYASNNNYRRWDSRSWRNDRRYDWHDYRSSNRSIYRLGSYYAPYRGYSYRRLSIGFSLDSLFFGNRYWINDPGYYRLPARIRTLPLDPLLRRCAAGRHLFGRSGGRDLRLLLVSGRRFCLPCISPRPPRWGLLHACKVGAGGR